MLRYLRHIRIDVCSQVRDVGAFVNAVFASKHFGIVGTVCATLAPLTNVAPVMIAAKIKVFRRIFMVCPK